MPNAILSLSIRRELANSVRVDFGAAAAVQRMCSNRVTKIKTNLLSTGEGEAKSKKKVVCEQQQMAMMTLRRRRWG